MVGAARRLEALGLNQGTAGNVGLRIDGGLLVTPTGLAPATLDEEDVVALAADGTVRPGERRRPTSEWQLHAAVLAARPDVGAVVHTHSPEATAVACLRRSLPAVHYVVAWTGRSVVPCVDYATYGSAELAANVVAALGDGGACLMANHGLLTVAATLDRAVAWRPTSSGWPASIAWPSRRAGRSCWPTTRSPASPTASARTANPPERSPAGGRDAPDVGRERGSAPDAAAGAGVAIVAPSSVPMGVMQRRRSTPSTTDSHLPQMPSWQPRRGRTCSAISRMAFSAAMVGSHVIR